MQSPHPPGSGTGVPYTVEGYACAVSRCVDRDVKSETLHVKGMIMKCLFFCEPAEMLGAVSDGRRRSLTAPPSTQHLTKSK